MGRKPRSPAPGASKAATDELADLLVARVEERVGSIERVTLVSLHLALADQIVGLLRAGATVADIDPVLTEAWNKIRVARERAEGNPAQTHQNESAYVC